MKTFWLNKKNNSHLILFFAGWGMDENPLKHLVCGDNDVLLFYDYRDLTLTEDLSNYEKTTVIAWSFGVFTASLVCQNLKIDNAIAINGTQIPIDSKLGIPAKIFQLTLDNLDETGRDKFFQNMFATGDDYEKFISPKRNIEAQREELIAIQNLANSAEILNFDYNCAIISCRDKIIPTRNQQRFWQTKKVKVIELEGGHFPFFAIDSLEEIIDEKIQ